MRRGAALPCSTVRALVGTSAAPFVPAFDQARYITGHVLVVDGGATLVGPSRASQ